jgi:hypothetical protein
MVDPSKQNQALNALQRVLTLTRTMALEGQPACRVAGVLDWAELLPRYLAVEQDKTNDFRKALAAIVAKEPQFEAAAAVFDRPEPSRW